MTIISRYIAKEFFKYFFLVLIIVLSIFVTTDYLTRITSFIKAGISLLFGFEYVLLKVPYMAIMLMPVCAILSVLILFGFMNKKNEIMALQSGGISSYTLLRPVVVIGLLLSVFCFFVSEVIVPVTASKVSKIRIVDIKKRSITTTKNNNIWLKKNNEILRIDHYDPKTKIVSGVTIYQFTADDFKLFKRIDAVNGFYGNNMWVLQNIVESVYDQKMGVFVSKNVAREKYKINLNPSDFKSVIKESMEMSILDLLKYIRKNESEGYDAKVSIVDLHAKFAFPFVSLIMLIAGTGIALGVKKETSIPVMISYGLFFSFSFWVFYSICITLGYGGILPAPVAAWTASFVFIFLSGYILLNAE